MSTQTKAGAVVYAKNLAHMARFYAQVFGLEIVHSEAGHAVLESPTLQLVLVAIPDVIAATIEVAKPPVRREETPIKLVFWVGRIGELRSVVASLGGALDPPEREWRFQGSTVCDGHDPEGNVLQFREAT